MTTAAPSLQAAVHPQGAKDSAAIQLNKSRSDFRAKEILTLRDLFSWIAAPGLALFEGTPLAMTVPLWSWIKP